MSSGARTWWERRALDLEAHQKVEIPRVAPERLEEMGYYTSIGFPKGQGKDLRRPLDDGRGFHVRVYSDRTTVHWDHVDPSVSPIGHLARDSPGMLAAGGLGLLALAVALVPVLPP